MPLKDARKASARTTTIIEGSEKAKNTTSTLNRREMSLIKPCSAENGIDRPKAPKERSKADPPTKGLVAKSDAKTTTTALTSVTRAATISFQKGERMASKRWRSYNKSQERDKNTTESEEIRAQNQNVPESNDTQKTSRKESGRKLKKR